MFVMYYCIWLNLNPESLKSKEAVCKKSLTLLTPESSPAKESTHEDDAECQTIENSDLLENEVNRQIL